MNYKRESNVIGREVAGEHLLVPISGDMADMRHLFALNETGRFIWQQLENEVSEDELVRRLINAYDVTAATAHADVRALLDALLERQLIAAFTGSEA